MSLGQDDMGQENQMGLLESRFQAIVDRQVDGIVVVDPENRVCYINPAAETLLNYRGKRIGETFGWNLKPNETIEVEVIQSETAVRTMQLQSTRTQWDGQRAYLISVRDVSERRRKEDQLKKAVEAAEQRAADLEAMKFVADQLNQAALLEEAVQSSLDTILSLVDAHAAWILLPDESGGTRLIANYNRSSLLRSEKRMLASGFHCKGLERHLAGELDGATLIKSADCMRSAGLSPNLPDEHYSVPLSIKNKPIGVLNISLKQDKELDVREVQLLNTVSQQLALTIERSLPLAGSNEALRKEEILKKVSRTVSSSLDLPTVLQNILRLAVDLVGCEAGSLGLLTPNKQHLTFLSNFPGSMRQHTLNKNGDVLWNVVQSGESILIPDAGAIEEKLPNRFALRAKSLIIAPIVVGRDILGVLVLYNTTPGKALNEFDQSLAGTLGQQAGIAVQNAQLFFEVQQLTVTDPLTGLNNQKSFINQAVRELERTWRYKRPLSIISILIDDIRGINENYGRESGDEVLQVLARVLVEGLRRVDVMGRYTGNNFIILLPETDLTGAREVAERIRRKVEDARVDTQKGPVHFSISLGVAGLSDSEVIDLERFMDRANQALYSAVQTGGNKVLAWESGNRII
jgi:diguanylate cyclase (GGDEF)-like protein